MKHLLTAVLLLLTINTIAQTDSLDSYVNRLKSSKQNGGNETAFMSIGSDFLYAQEYFEAGNFSSAEYSFRAILRRDENHPYANYQMAIALYKQKDRFKREEAEKLLNKAFKAIPSLKQRFAKDVPDATLVKSGTDNPNNPPVIAQDTPVPPAEMNGLDAYIYRIKSSRANSGSETVMNSAGLDAFYGIEYYEAGEYRSAETNFSLSLAKDPSNPYVNYMKAVSLAAQGKTAEAKPFLAKAVAADKTLQQQYTKDAAAATAKWKKNQAKNEVKTTTATKVKYGGPLVYGNYTCHVSVWNGPNVSPAYRQDYKGYFALKKDGTYRWLDDGVTGRYSYDAKTGKITWLSGYFKTAPPKLTQYQPGTTVAQITVTYSDNLRWECGCKKL